MSVGDLTKLPTAGIQAVGHVTSVTGTSTTMYLGYDNGKVKTLTTSGVVADLTTKVILPGKIVSLVYTGLTAILCAITADGKIYKITSLGVVTLLKNLNMGVCGAYYVSNYLYIVLDSMQQEKSNLLKLQLA